MIQFFRRRWEGIDEESIDVENDWRGALAEGFDAEDEFETETWQVNVNPTQNDPNYRTVNNDGTLNLPS